MSYQNLKIYRPVSSKKITQGWGENRACIDANGKIFGTSTYCPSGSTSFYKSVGMLGHNGIDISEFVGADVYHGATFVGWMKTETDINGGIGVDVISKQPLFFEGKVPTSLKGLVPQEKVNGVNGFTSFVKMRYWHLKSPIGYDGKEVLPGQVIGLSGNSGASSGPHLHFAPKWCDREGKGIGKDNGFYGAFDPTPFYDHQSIIKDKITTDLTEEEREMIKKQISVLEQILRLFVKLKEVVHN